MGSGLIVQARAKWMAKTGVHFAANRIEETGAERASLESHEIVDYGRDQASKIVDTITDDDEMQLLVLISEFDYVSMKMLTHIFAPTVLIKNLDTLVAMGAVESVGGDSEYYRVSSVLARHQAWANKYSMKKFQRKF